jgi:hypothetical protein
MTPLQACRLLHTKCVLAYEDEPGIEVGKVRQSAVVPGAYFFHVYVMGHDKGGMSMQRSNTVHCSPERLFVEGPDEQTIGAMLAERGP